MIVLSSSSRRRASSAVVFTVSDVIESGSMLTDESGSPSPCAYADASADCSSRFWVNSSGGIGSEPGIDTCTVGSYEMPTFWSNASSTNDRLNCARLIDDAKPSARMSDARHGITGLTMKPLR